MSSEHIRLILGLKLNQARIDSDLSLQALSKQVGLSVSYLNEIEKGKSACLGMDQETDSIPSLQTIIRRRAAITGLALTGSKQIKMKVEEQDFSDQ